MKTELDAVLSGKTVILTRPAAAAVSLVHRLQRVGAFPLVEPLIDVRAVYDAAVSASARDFERYDALLFTSANGVRAFCEALGSVHLGVNQKRAFTVGEMTRQTAEEAGFAAIHPSGVRTSAALASYLCSTKELEGKTALWVHGNQSDESFTDVLRSCGVHVEACACYETVIRAPRVEHWSHWLATHSKACVVFHSPSAVQALKQGFVDGFPDTGAVFVSVGPTTTSALNAAGLGPVVTAEKPTDDAVLSAIRIAFTDAIAPPSSRP